MGYIHKTDKCEYYLHTSDVRLKSSGKLVPIYYFLKEVDDSKWCDIPEGKKVVVNKKTGIPFLKSK